MRKTQRQYFLGFCVLDKLKHLEPCKQEQRDRKIKVQCMHGERHENIEFDEGSIKVA